MPLMGLTIGAMFDQCAALYSANALRQVRVPVTLSYAYSGQDRQQDQFTTDATVSGYLVFVPQHETQVQVPIPGTTGYWTLPGLIVPPNVSGMLAGEGDAEEAGGPGGDFPVPAVYLAISLPVLVRPPVAAAVTMKSTQNLSASLSGKVDPAANPVTFTTPQDPPGETGTATVTLNIGTPYWAFIQIGPPRPPLGG